MSIRHLAATMALLVVMSAVAVFGSDRAREAQFQRAVDRMERGDLPGAAALFEEVAGSTDRALAARALFYLGILQERQGRDAARETYERIVTLFRDQRDVFDKAQERLVALEPRPVSSSPARVPVAVGDDADATAHVTPDGRFLSRPDWETGDIVVRNLHTGEVRRLLQKAAWDDTYAEQVMIAPDASRVLYVWWGADNRYQLRVMANELGAAPTDLMSAPDCTYFQPIGWSRDSRRALVVGWTADREAQLIWVDVTNGKWEILHSLGHQDGTGRFSLSPDGGYVAYTMLAAPRQRNPQGAWIPTTTHQHIYVLPTDRSGTEAAVVTGPNINESPIWTPDGKRLLFVSNRGWDFTFGLWSVAVDRGRRTGSEDYVGAYTPGRIRPIGMTRAGTLYYVPERIAPGAGRDIFVAELDAGSGRAIGAATRMLDTHVDANFAPAWSPDGTRLVYLRGRRDSQDSTDWYEVVVHTLATRHERVFFRPNLVAMPPLWLPDGRHVLVRRGTGLVRWNVETDDERSMESVAHSILPAGLAAVAPDGAVLYFLGAERVDPAGASRLRIVAFDLRTAEGRVVWTSPLCPEANRNCYNVSRPVISPDGRSLAITLQRTGNAQARLVVVGTDGATQQALPVEVVPNTVTWAPDSRSVLVVRPSDSGEAELVRVSTGDGRVTPTGLTLKRPHGHTFDLSRDGSRLVYSDSTRSADHETLWAYENLLALLFQ